VPRRSTATAAADSPEASPELEENLEWALPADLGAGTTRTRAADYVFESLAGAILKGQLRPNSPLPPERELATRFQISRVLVREAIHKLKELGLVRVRQGGQTVVLDPANALDPRVIILMVELAAASGSIVRDLLEQMLLMGGMLLELAELRMVTSQIEELERIVQTHEKSGPSWANHMSFWLKIAESSKNEILFRQTRYWFQMMQARGGGPSILPFDEHERLRIARGIVDRLRRREGAAKFYLDQIRPLLSG
jgi:DNA-binding FadR family transcriptional regulator